MTLATSLSRFSDSGRSVAESVSNCTFSPISSFSSDTLTRSGGGSGGGGSGSGGGSGWGAAPSQAYAGEPQLSANLHVRVSAAPHPAASARHRRIAIVRLDRIANPQGEGSNVRGALGLPADDQCGQTERRVDQDLVHDVLHAERHADLVVVADLLERQHDHRLERDAQLLGHVIHGGDRQ